MNGSDDAIFQAQFTFEEGGCAGVLEGKKQMFHPNCLFIVLLRFVIPFLVVRQNCLIPLRF